MKELSAGELFAVDQKAWDEWGKVVAAAIVTVRESGYSASVEVPAPPPCLVAQRLGRASGEAMARMAVADYTESGEGAT